MKSFFRVIFKSGWTSVRPRRVQNACARGTRTPSTRAARARALFLKNAVLHASTRAHACARAVFENNEFFQLYEPWPTYYLEHEKIILELRNSVILNVRIIVLTYLKLFRVTKLSQNCIGRMKTNC